MQLIAREPQQRQQHPDTSDGADPAVHHESAGSSSIEAGGMRRALSKEKAGGAGGSRLPQSLRGVTWDKMKKMWRVRVCLAGGGREHVGYFLDEKEGAMAYLRAVERIKLGTYVSNSNKDLKVSESGLAAAAAAAAKMGSSQMGILPFN